CRADSFAASMVVRRVWVCMYVPANTRLLKTISYPDVLPGRLFQVPGWLMSRGERFSRPAPGSPRRLWCRWYAIGFGRPSRGMRNSPWRALTFPLSAADICLQTSLAISSAPSSHAHLPCTLVSRLLQGAYKLLMQTESVP